MSDQNKFSQKLKGQHCLVIGGSSGLIENGSAVTVSSSNPTKVKNAVSSLKAAYPSAANRISGHACDLGNEDTTEDSIRNLLQQISGKLDHIIFTAADSLAMMPVEDITIDKMKKASLLRFYAPLLIAKYAPQYLNPGPCSWITFATGSVAQKPLPQWAVIGSYATAIEGMTRGLALDLKPIRVNCVAPRVVDTNLWTDEQRKAVFPGLAATLPVGRVARAEDVAEAYLYLVKDENVDGTMIATNGGALLI